MKKIWFFLTIILTLVFIPNIKVKANSYSFYMAERIDGVYYNMYDPATGRLHYQRGMFFRERTTNAFAYCIEPFRVFFDDSTYTEFNPDKLTVEQKNKISAIAHFGYGYKNHTDPKWYAVAQFLIWQVANPEGDYYFTSYLNGPRITLFTEEIKEINKLVNDYFSLPAIANKDYYIVDGSNLVITDENMLIDNFSTLASNVKIENNQVIISNSKIGNNEIYFERKENTYNKPIIFYQSATSQNLVDTGDIPNVKFKINLHVDTTSVNIIKVDKDTKKLIPSGDASLDGAIYELYDANMKKIATITIKDNRAYLKNLNYGTYYLKEIKAGQGYTVNNELIKFNISYDNKDVNLTVLNEVIKSKIKISKKYGSNDNFLPEENITFNIYDKDNKLVKTIVTSVDGVVEVILPYGKYTLKQVNTTDGYTINDPVEFEVLDGKEINFEFKDYKIEVPDTKTNFIKRLILFFIYILC